MVSASDTQGHRGSSHLHVQCWDCKLVPTPSLKTHTHACMWAQGLGLQGKSAKSIRNSSRSAASLSCLLSLNTVTSLDFLRNAMRNTSSSVLAGISLTFSAMLLYWWQMLQNRSQPSAPPPSASPPTRLVVQADAIPSWSQDHGVQLFSACSPMHDAHRHTTLQEYFPRVAMLPGMCQACCEAPRPHCKHVSAPLSLTATLRGRNCYFQQFGRKRG